MSESGKIKQKIMSERVPLNWFAMYQASHHSGFLELLLKVPCDRWAEHNKVGTTLLHLACHGQVAAAVALIQSGRMDVNARDDKECTPAIYAAVFEQPRVLEVLCAAGADLRAADKHGRSLFDLIISNRSAAAVETHHVLVANGLRLSTVCAEESRFISSELWAFERGVLRCRTAVVAMMRVKKAGELWRWDRFLLREMAYAVWATRYEKKWQN